MSVYSLFNAHALISFVQFYLNMCNGAEWSKDKTGSGVNKVETTAGVWQQSVFTCSAADSFQHTQNPHAHA